MNRRRRSRVIDTPAFVLNATAWSEHSVIAHIFSREHGVVVVVAKSAQRPYSVLRPIMSHFHPLLLSWSGRGEVKTLTQAELNGFLPIQGRTLMSAWYLNELILSFLAPEDPHPELYDLYLLTLEQLAQGQRVNPLLRRFEWQLLELVGYGLSEPMPDFDDERYNQRWLRQLRSRIDEHLEGKSVKTREVNLSLHRLIRQGIISNNKAPHNGGA